MNVLRTGILDFCRRKKRKPFSPKEVIQLIFPQDWELFLPEIFEEMKTMCQDGLIEVQLDSKKWNCEEKPTGNEMILGVKKPI